MHITCNNNAIVLSQNLVKDQEELVAHRVVEPTALWQRTGLLCQVIPTICTYAYSHVNTTDLQYSDGSAATI